MKQTDSQNKQILDYLQKGRSLTQAEAAGLFNCWRLGARIKDLRDAGYPIITTMVDHGSGRHARYSLTTQNAPSMQTQCGCNADA